MKKLSLCWVVTLWICAIFSAKAQITIYEHGAEITSIDQIKDGTLFVMKKGSEYLCFPEVQNASLKDLTSASSSKAFFFQLQTPESTGETVPEEIKNNYIIRVLTPSKEYYSFWGANNSYLNAASWVIYSMALFPNGNIQWGNEKLYSAIWDLQYNAEENGWTIKNIGQGKYMNHAGGPGDNAEFWKLYKAEVDINDITITNVQEDVAEAKAILDSKMGVAAKSNLIDGLSTAEAATEANARDVYQTFHPVFMKAKASVLYYSYVAPYIGVEEKIDGTGRAYLRTTGYSEISQQYADGTLDENSTDNVIASIKEWFYTSVKAQRTPGSSMTLAIINPSFEMGTLEGWKSENGGDVATNYNFQYRTGDKFVERYTWEPSLSAGSLTQTIQGLPNGTYTLTAEMQNVVQSNNSAPGEGYYLVANSDRKLVTLHGETVSVTTVVTDGTLTIGTVIDNCTGNWVCVDNFQLTYVKALEETPKPSEFDGTPITLASSGNATLEVGEDEVRVLTFTNLWASCAIENVPIDKSVTKSITFEFAEPAPVHFNVPVKVQDEADPHYKGFDAGTTIFTLNFDEFNGLITNVSIQNTQETGQHSLSLKAAYLTQKDGKTTNLKLTSGWGSSISYPYVTSGNVAFSGIWAYLPLNGIENIEEGLKLRIYTDDALTTDQVQFKVTYADGEKEVEYPQIGSPENNYLTTISRPVSSIGLQWVKEEAGKINIKAITWEKDKEIFPGITVTADKKWATYISQVDCSVPAGLRAFTCDGIKAENDALVLTELGSSIPANTPCILYNTTADDLTIDRIFGDIQAEKAPCKVGLLTGVYHKTFVPDGSYILQKQGDDTGFFICDQPNTITVARNRCYLTVPAAAAAKSRSFIFNEPGTTGIPSVQGSISKMMNGSDIYDAQGRKLKSMQKGINIINGVKVRIK